jgi:hypothetical protein
LLWLKVSEEVHFLEAVDESDGRVLCDFGFDVFSDWGGSEEREILSFLLAEVVSSDCGQEHGESA